MSNLIADPIADPIASALDNCRRMWYTVFNIQHSHKGNLTMSNWTSSAKFAGAPYFYGASKITVPVGTTVNLKSGLFRLMAHDVYDGDITHKISASATSVDTSTLGTTEIRYDVTNSRGTSSSIVVQVIAAECEKIIVERLVFCHPKQDLANIEIPSPRRANKHCSQHLGIYMPPHSSFDIRVLEAEEDLNLMSYACYASMNIHTVLPQNGERVTITLEDGVRGHDDEHHPEMGRVVMIKSPRSDNCHCKVEITYSLVGEGKVMGLDYFHYGDTNQDEFLQNWTEERTYAIIANNYIMLMIPWNDRDELIGNTERNFKHNDIHEIFAYYEFLVTNYNRLYGLCIDTDVKHNRLVHTRFWVIPQSHGPGWAYYGGDHIAMSTKNLKGKPTSGGYTVYPYLHKDWTSLHELGHGYDSNFSGSKEHGMGEVTNNIFSHIVKQKYTTDPKYMWYFDYGKETIESLEEKTFAVANGHFVAGFRERLFMIVSMLEATGQVDKVWAAAHSLNRETATRGENWMLADLFAQAAFDVTGLNMTPYLHHIGLYPKQEVRDAVKAGRTPYFAHLLTAFPKPVEITEGVAVRANSYASNNSKPENIFSKISAEWHSRYDGGGKGTTAFPFFLEFDFGSEVELAGLELTTRSASLNGRFQAGKITVHPSTGDTWPGGEDFLPMDSEWSEVAPLPVAPISPATPITQEIQFGQPVKTRFLRFEITDGHGGHATLGFFRPLYHGVEEEEVVEEEVSPVSSEEIMAKEGLLGRWSAVFPCAERGLTASAVLEICDPAALSDKTILVKDGTTTVCETTIDSGEVVTAALPVGAYTLEIAGATIKNPYLIVRSIGENRHHIDISGE